MRISSNMIYNAGLSGIQTQTASMLKSTLQLSSGKRILTPADDPAAASQALQLDQTLSQLTQFNKNLDSVAASLNEENTQLTSVTDQLQSIRDLFMQSGNSTLTATDRNSLATELRGRFADLLGLANSKDATGTYVFSGYQNSTEPFSADLNSLASGTQSDSSIYLGDQGQREVQVSPNERLAVGDAGTSVFYANGQSVFKTIADLVTQLESSSGATTAQRTTALANLDAVMANVSSTASSVGTRLNQVDALQSVNADLKVNYQTQLSNLQDVDVTQATIDLTRYKTNLEAAQASYSQIAALSLFNYIS